jgi:hypothetical protein
MAAADSINEIRTLRIELCDSDPLIWRRVEVLFEHERPQTA